MKHHLGHKTGHTKATFRAFSTPSRTIKKVCKLAKYQRHPYIHAHPPGTRGATGMGLARVARSAPWGADVPVGAKMSQQWPFAGILLGNSGASLARYNEARRANLSYRTKRRKRANSRTCALAWVVKFRRSPPGPKPPCGGG